MSHKFDASTNLYDLQYPPKRVWGKRRTSKQLRQARPFNIGCGPLGLQYFSGKPFETYEELESEMQRIGAELQLPPEMMKRWNFNRVVYYKPHIRVRLRAKKITGEPFLKIAELVSDNGSWFTAGELYFKAYNFAVEKMPDAVAEHPMGWFYKHHHVDGEPQAYDMTSTLAASKI